MTNTSIKLPHFFRELKKSDFDLMFPGEENLGIKPNTTDTVLLNAQQQRRLLESITDLTGMQVNRTSLDFKRMNDFIPASLAMSLGANEEVYNRSTANYKKAIDSLRFDQQAQQDYLMTMPVGRKLLSEQGASWYKSGQAQRLLEARINFLEQQQAEDY